MKIHGLTFAALVALAAFPLAAMSQASAPQGVAETPAPPAARLGPRLLTPMEKRDSATPAGDLRPERRVTPQISVPLGRKPPPTDAADSKAAPHTDPAPAGGIDDAAARCESRLGEQVRAKCRDQLAREGRVR